MAWAESIGRVLMRLEYLGGQTSMAEQNTERDSEGSVDFKVNNNQTGCSFLHNFTNYAAAVCS